MTSYEILNVTKFSSTDEIKSAYRKLAKQYHPDLNKAPSAQLQFHNINLAYNDLLKNHKQVIKVTRLKFYEFVKDYQYEVIIRTHENIVPASSCAYLMWKDNEYKIPITSDQKVPFEVKHFNPNFLVKFIK